MDSDWWRIYRHGPNFLLLSCRFSFMSPALPQERWHPVSRKSYVTITVADLRGAWGLAPPLQGNPGSTTALDVVIKPVYVCCKFQTRTVNGMKMMTLDSTSVGTTDGGPEVVLPEPETDLDTKRIDPKSRRTIGNPARRPFWILSTGTIYFPNTTMKTRLCRPQLSLVLLVLTNHRTEGHRVIICYLGLW